MLLEPSHHPATAEPTDEPATAEQVEEESVQQLSALVNNVALTGASSSHSQWESLIESY